MRLSPTSGAPDLYTHSSSSISTSNYLCKPYEGGTKVEICSLLAPHTGTNYVLVKGYKSSGYKLKVSVQ